MLRGALVIALFLLAGCRAGDEPFNVAKDPTSVRGWVLDVKGAKRAETIEMELARRSQLFAATSVWVENVQYASGGIAENGAFVVLDVPPQNATLGFNAPGAETARVELRNVPANADVLIPNLILSNGGASVLDPSKIVVRVAADVSKPTPAGKTATVAGYQVPVVNVPLSQLADRRDYPAVPGIRPVATVR
ncbi:MAG TPA: hypothetical protein VND45_13610 [Thermoanaerobaculia bacterium]|nr:hypothetical protein [Thermoanaerobaculia bacterium]